MAATSDARHRRIALRIGRLRFLLLGLGLLPVLVLLQEWEAPAVAWGLAVANALLWPWAARRLASQHPEPLAVERRNLGIDALFAGIWVALLQFSLVPSAALASTLLASLAAVGGSGLVWRGLGLFLGAALLLSALNGFAFEPGSSLPATVASLPLLLGFPLLLASRLGRMGRHLAGQDQRLAALERQDPLTGLANRRALLEAAEHEFRRFRRSGHRASFMVVDIDRFRELDAPPAEAALRRVAAILKRSLRDTDTCGRLEGDRFGVVLADASGSGVGELAERLRHAVATAAADGGPGPHPTVSIGYAQVEATMANSGQWIAAAQAALQGAKALGRNRSLAAPALGAYPP